DLRCETLELRQGIENDLVCMTGDFCNVMICIGHAVRMRFSTELLAPEAHLVQRRGRRAVHVLAELVEHRPGSKAFEREEDFGAAELTQAIDPAHIVSESAFVDEVIRGLN